jgi:hypothetical protein
MVAATAALPAMTVLRPASDPLLPRFSSLSWDYLLRKEKSNFL